MLVLGLQTTITEIIHIMALCQLSSWSQLAQRMSVLCYAMLCSPKQYQLTTLVATVKNSEISFHETLMCVTNHLLSTVCPRKVTATQAIIPSAYILVL